MLHFATKHRTQPTKKAVNDKLPLHQITEITNFNKAFRLRQTKNWQREFKRSDYFKTLSRTHTNYRRAQREVKGPRFSAVPLERRVRRALTTRSTNHRTDVKKFNKNNILQNPRKTTQLRDRLAPRHALLWSYVATKPQKITDSVAQTDEAESSKNYKFKNQLTHTRKIKFHWTGFANL